MTERSTAAANPPLVVDQEEGEETEFQTLYLRMVAKRFLVRWVWLLLVGACALNLGKYFWIERHYQGSVHWLLISVVEVFDFVTIALVVVTRSVVEHLEVARIPQNLRLAGRSWQEIWRPVFLLLLLICAINTSVEFVVVASAFYEAQFLDWWVFGSYLLLYVPLCYFAAASLAFLNAWGLARLLQILVLLAFAYGFNGLMLFGDSFLFTLLADHFWTSALGQKITNYFAEPTLSRVPVTTDWLLQFRTSTLLFCAVIGLLLLALARLVLAGTPVISERRLIASR